MTWWPMIGGKYYISIAEIDFKNIFRSSAHWAEMVQEKYFIIHL